jgi:uncharacterized protein YjbI with pentapeptide repeats
LPARIVTTTYRYKRPPRKRKAVPLEGPVIVTAKRRPGRFGDAPDLTPEEHRRRGDAAGALFREMVRLVTVTGADLSGADLSGADLSEADLVVASLRRADLSGARIVSADLRGAHLGEAYLNMANFTDAYLDDTIISNVDLL